MSSCGSIVSICRLLPVSCGVKAYLVLSSQFVVELVDALELRVGEGQLLEGVNPPAVSSQDMGSEVCCALAGFVSLGRVDDSWIEGEQGARQDGFTMVGVDEDSVTSLWSVMVTHHDDQSHYPSLPS